MFPAIPAGFPSCLEGVRDKALAMFRYVQYPDPNTLPSIATTWPQWSQGCKLWCDKLGVDGDLQPISAYLKAFNSASSFCRNNNSCSTKLDACKARCETTQKRFSVAPIHYTEVCLSTASPTLCADEHKYADDTAMDYAVKQAFGRELQRGKANVLKCSKYCDDPTRTRSQLGQNPPVFGACHNYEELCVDGQVFVDQSCRPVADSNATHCTLQYTVTYEASSPISLMWQRDARIDEAATLVKFKLDISSPDSWYVWYGSADTPLLVYDPSDTRKVTSVTQLFGNWTFGGKKEARATNFANDAATGTVRGAPWRDGYEALATLDSDGDGKVSGGELSPLALWFDRNRDAVSQPGEIVELSDSGVTSLSVGPGVADAQTRHVRVESGFTRTVNGVEQTGGTVDWYGDGAATMQELVIEQRLKSSAHSSELDQLLKEASARPAAAEPQVVAAPAALSGVPGSKLTGFWVWRGVDDGEKVRDRGMLMLREHQGGWLEVVSLTETPLEDRRGDLQGIRNLKVLGGSIAADPSGATKVSFSSLGASATSGPKGPAVTSEATLSDPDTLTGTTTERLTGPDGKTSTITYQWVAKRQPL